MTSAPWNKAIIPALGGIVLRLKVVPGASRTRLAGMLGDRLKIAVAAPAQGGRANQAAVELLAKTLGVALRQISILTGLTQPFKTLAIAGIDVAAALSRLEQAR